MVFSFNFLFWKSHRPLCFDVLFTYLVLFLTLFPLNFLVNCWEPKFHYEFVCVYPAFRWQILSNYPRQNSGCHPQEPLQLQLSLDVMDLELQKLQLPEHLSPDKMPKGGNGNFVIRLVIGRSMFTSICAIKRIYKNHIIYFKFMSYKTSTCPWNSTPILHGVS